MKRLVAVVLALVLTMGMLSGCGKNEQTGQTAETNGETANVTAAAVDTPIPGVQIALSDEGIRVDGQPATGDDAQAVYTANDIVYYEDGRDFTYGEGSEADAHSAEEAGAHTVVHITRPGQYVISGTLSRGQIAVDLGADAKEDPDAVVTLVLNGVDITCQVAPAVIFYNVYECGVKDEETATKDVDTTAAGANIVLADGSVNTVNGAYVARIYKPDSVVLNEAGTEVEDAKKLHKYDGAVYSKMSMNVNGGEKGTGTLYINAANEGLDSELHLTVNGGNIYIVSGNDGINTNEDYVSVTTVNGGMLSITVDGSTGEGDGIDSNGWLVINGGSVFAQACAASGDAGIDSDMGIHINGGTVVATGNMLDRIGESEQTFVVFQFAGTREGGVYTLKDANDTVVLEREIENRFAYLIMSDEKLAEGEYSLWAGDSRLQGTASGGMMSGGMMPGWGDMGRPEGEEPPVMPEGVMPPKDMENMMPPGGVEWPESVGRPEMPEGGMPPEGMENMTPPEGMNWEGRPDGGRGENRPVTEGETAEASPIFRIKKGENYFSAVDKTGI